MFNKGSCRFFGVVVSECLLFVYLFSYLLTLLAEEGYLIISVPYNVTFDHEQVTKEIYERFHACLDSILSTGLPENGISAEEIADLPFYSVGHR